MSCGVTLSRVGGDGPSGSGLYCITVGEIEN